MMLKVLRVVRVIFFTQMEGTYSLEPYPKGKLRSFLLTVITLGRLSDIRERWDREKL